MDIAISLCLGQAQAIRQAVQFWRPNTAPSESLFLAVEVMRDATVRMGELAARVMAETWRDLEAGRVGDAETAGAALERLLDAVGDALHTLQRHAQAMAAAGLDVPDMSALERTRNQLGFDIVRFREGWPMSNGEPGPDEDEDEAPVEAYDLGVGD